MSPLLPACEVQAARAAHTDIRHRLPPPHTHTHTHALTTHLDRRFAFGHTALVRAAYPRF